MKKFLYILALAALALPACQQQEPQSADSDLVEVRLKLAGYYGAPLSDYGQSRATTTEQDTPNYPRDLEDYTPHDLPNGSTVWVSIEHTKGDEPGTISPFVVHDGQLYPCEVNDDGSVRFETNRPIYLKRDHQYDIKIMGPARKLTDDGRLYIENGQEVYSHDSRYDQTKPQKAFEIHDETTVTELVLNPVIQQTAKLKFTIVTEGKWEYLRDEDGKMIPEDPESPTGIDSEWKQYWLSPIHSLEINESGVVITGLQEHYSQKGGSNPIHDPYFEGEDDYPAEPWNWKWDETYLIPFPGKVRNYMTLTAANATEMTNNKLVLETCILPCDATSTPIIVGFYLRVNGVPTQFEMMLNRKQFLSAYCYHYKGTLSIKGGISVIEWQTIIQELDPIDMDKP